MTHLRSFYILDQATVDGLMLRVSTCAFVCFDKVILKGYNPDLVSVTGFSPIHLGRMQRLSYTHRIHGVFAYIWLEFMVNAGENTMYTWMLWVISEVPLKSLSSRRADSC